MVRFGRYIMVMLMLLTTLITWAQPGQTVQIGQGSSVVLRADAANTLSYLWFHNGEPINGHHDQRLTVSEEGIYTVLALGNECHSDMSDPVEVIVDSDGEPITVDMAIRNEPDRPTVLMGSIFTYQLFVINNGDQIATDVTVTASLPQNISYEGALGMHTGTLAYHPAIRELTWTLGTMGPGQSEALTISVRAESGGTASQLAVVSSSQTDSNPADNKAAAVVEVIALKVPNVFTPNGDGVNDYFEIPGLAQFPEHRLIIFNRWGNEIFKSTNYQNNWNGSNLGEGTYYYVLELKLHTGHWETFKGFVTIIRNMND